ncbi:MAG: TonB-dependent siderophore receptor [Leptolyngbyaceae cyanobacterium RU_5_1]|nr:TonB-dependent siderophore receptor [Leptolyngbyaceae cyanobacterium RU_5_1]
MVKQQLQCFVLAAGVVSVLGVPAAGAEVATDFVANGSNSSVSSVLPSVANISRVRDSQRPATTVKEWLAQVEASTVQVTDVRVDRTDTGLEITLGTTSGKLLQVDATKFRSEGNSLIAEIPNAVLALSDGQEFSANNPTTDIAAVRITQLDASTIRVSVTGNNALPKSDVTLKTGEFAYSLNPEVDEPDEEIVVTGERDGYRVPNATTATKTDTPIRNIPQSIQVIPRQILRDQAGTQISDALRNVSSLTNINIPGSFGDSGTSRGFFSGRNYFINGINSPFAGQNIDLETFNLEQIEVLKGPGSVLYGRGEPGAVINVVTKQPLPDPTYSIGLEVGNFNYYRPTLDLSGPLNADKTARYRLNLLYQNTDSFVDFLNFETFAVAPVLSFELGKKTKLTLEGQYFHYSESSYFTGLPASGTLFTNPLGRVPFSRNLGDPQSNAEPQGPSSFGSIGYRLEHKFSDNWSIRNAFNFENYNSTYTYLLTDGLDETDNRTVYRSASRTDPGDGLSQSFVLQTDVIGKVLSGNIKQEILFGVELRRRTIKGVFQSAPAAATDLFNPVYGIDIPDTDFAVDNDSFSKQNNLGIYVQDLVSIGENLHILLGGRFDLVKQIDENKLTEETLEQQDTAFSPRIGIVYQPIREVSLYANYSRSFEPSENASNVNLDGSPFKPTKGEQFEVGMKTEWLDGKLSATLAAYQIEKQNIITRDPDNPGFRIQIGEQRSRGIELDVVGQVLPGLNLIASYSYIDAEITKDNGGFAGNRPSLVPTHRGSLWATYEIQRGSLKGFGFGGGVFITGDRKGDLDNSFDLPGYTRVDAALFYRRDNWRVGLNFKNLFNRDYFESAFSRESLFPGAPFTVVGTVSVSF